MIYIYSNLKKIRNYLKLSQNSFANLLELNVSNISRWENKKNGMSLDTAWLISKKLNIPIPELIAIDLTNEKIAEYINKK